MRVFVSSTVYDLLDARAELCALFRSMGASPVLSNDKLSEFRVQPEANSIETCLVNVANSDAVIVVLDQRYGPRLGKVGFDDLSATHLEYRHAKQLKKPIYFYVRDRLEAEFATWRKNKKKMDLNLSWIRPEDAGLFELLDEHRQLRANSKVSNWYSTFTNTVDLKEAIRKHVGPQVKPQLVMDALAQNRFPLFAIDTEFDQINLGLTFSLKVELTMTNVGGSPAFNFSSRWSTEKEGRESRAIFAPTQSTTATLLSNMQAAKSEIDVQIYLDYDAAIGVHVSETYNVRVLLQRGPNPGVMGGATFVSRVFRNAPDLQVTIEE